MTAASIAHLRIKLDDVEPAVVRRAEVPLTIRLDRLHLPQTISPQARLIRGLRRTATDYSGEGAAQSCRVRNRSTREIAGKIEQVTRFSTTSPVLVANLLGPIIRSHWAIENSLRWVLDMIFRDDECRVRTDYAPANFATIRHMAQNLIRKAPAKASMRLKRKAAGWDDDVTAELITR